MDLNVLKNISSQKYACDCRHLLYICRPSLYFLVQFMTKGLCISLLSSELFRESRDDYSFSEFSCPLSLSYVSMNSSAASRVPHTSKRILLSSMLSVGSKPSSSYSIRRLSSSFLFTCCFFCMIWACSMSFLVITYF